MNYLISALLLIPSISLACIVPDDGNVGPLECLNCVNSSELKTRLSSVDKGILCNSATSLAPIECVRELRIRTKQPRLDFSQMAVVCSGATAVKKRINCLASAYNRSKKSEEAAVTLCSGSAHTSQDLDCMQFVEEKFKMTWEGAAAFCTAGFHYVKPKDDGEL